MNTNKKYNAEQIKEIGKRVRTLRKKMNLTQKQLAYEVKVHHDVIQRIESGKLKDVNIRILLSMAQPLNCNPKYLFLESDDYLNPLNRHSWYLSPPEENLVEKFIHDRPILANDLCYMLLYMHPDFQNQILDTLHTYVQFHQTAVHFPTVSREAARKLNPRDLTNVISLLFSDDENIFEKINKS